MGGCRPRARDKSRILLEKFRFDDAALLVVIIKLVHRVLFERTQGMKLATVCHDKCHRSLVSALHNTPPIFLMLPLNVRSLVSMESRTNFLIS